MCSNMLCAVEAGLDRTPSAEKRLLIMEWMQGFVGHVRFEVHRCYSSHLSYILIDRLPCIVQSSHQFSEDLAWRMELQAQHGL